MIKSLKSVHGALIGACMFLAVNLVSCTGADTAEVNLIPKPMEMTVSGGYLPVDVAALTGGQAENVVYQVNPDAADIAEEGYQLTVDKNGVKVVARTDAGLFYGKQTLLQLMTPDGLPYVSINDAPRFPYRGLHLDVSRHFFDKEEVMKLMDAMAYYKMNKLHLHLTDAGGWRIQIDKYPKLTSEGAYRTQSDWREWWDKGTDRKFVKEGTPGAYGGYYTKDDIRAMLAHAEKLHITIIPEIEFPAHSEEVFIGYPELNCAGKPYSGGDFCIGNPATFRFMEGVLTEIIELFPSEYIHIGGDEASKQTWKKCPKCQRLMKREGLADVNELQSYMIHRAENFLKSKGRRLIGWDEILEGGLAPDATVMSWRGEAAGFKSARMGHDVVMTPGAYLYLDMYQADPRTQPVAIGGYSPVKKVYSYNPIPKNSLTVEEAAHFLGVQGNIWTEFIPTEEHLEYMVFPRALAIAEIGWTPQNDRSWPDFRKRMNANIPVLQKMGIRPFTLSNEIEVLMNVDTLQQEITVNLDTEKYPAEIRYTMDGSIPTPSSLLYVDRIVVKDSADICAGVFIDGELQGDVTRKRVDYHMGIGKKIEFSTRLYSGYMAGGINAVIDGYRGGFTVQDQRWQGYLDNMHCVVDLGEVKKLTSVNSKWMQLIVPGIFQPSKVELLTSVDGKTFVSRGEILNDVSLEDTNLILKDYKFTGDWEARYVQLKASRSKKGGFIFVDEIVIW